MFRAGYRTFSTHPKNVAGVGNIARATTRYLIAYATRCARPAVVGSAEMEGEEMVETATLPSTQDLAGTWVNDPAHGSAEFSAKHMMISTVRGRFDDFTAAIQLAEDPSRSSVEATFRTASISTNQPDRDNHLRSADFLDVQKYPEMTFTSTNVEMTSDITARVTGDLTIRDTTKPVTLDVAFVDYLAKDMMGGTRVSFTATTAISRKEWGLTWNVALESGGVLVGDKVNIALEIEAIRQ